MLNACKFRPIAKSWDDMITEETNLKLGPIEPHRKGWHLREHFPPIAEIPMFFVAFPCLSVKLSLLFPWELEIYIKVASAKKILKRWGANDFKIEMLGYHIAKI